MLSQNMQEAFNCSFAVLRAMYEMADQDLAKWMELVQGSYDDGALQPSEEAIAKAKEWWVWDHVTVMWSITVGSRRQSER